MATFIVNGKVINTAGGKSVLIRDQRVIIDGQDVTPDAKEISIVVNGTVESIQADACSRISVTGDVGQVRTVSGNVEVAGRVAGSVQTVSGNVGCGEVAGEVSTLAGLVSERR